MNLSRIGRRMGQIRLTEGQLRQIVREELRRSGAARHIVEAGRLRGAAKRVGKWLTKSEKDVQKKHSPEEVKKAKEVAAAVKEAGGDPVPSPGAEPPPSVMGLKPNQVMRYLKIAYGAED